MSSASRPEAPRRADTCHADHLTARADLHLSEGTVRNYLSTAMAKMAEPTRVRAAVDMGWI
ncbi:hypothetical protein BKA00_000719 [Actinomadura coerulea]|uniref:Response regulator transcription factor n=1 Tax=Actinomadura coerulea TaxID=46159 RepID=A0A7X0FVA7_9ACTN|nr:hypothetical protein [Actinomadura coerulea]MBB6393805.1 hypothetical protein [Actinomadura coerulea]GGP90129.1 hypothetical protein GCM10010187_01810 [Actinomadura coerulea]